MAITRECECVHYIYDINHYVYIMYKLLCDNNIGCSIIIVISNYVIIKLAEVGEAWHGLLRESVAAPSWEVFKDVAWSNLV